MNKKRLCYLWNVPKNNTGSLFCWLFHKSMLKLTMYQNDFIEIIKEEKTLAEKQMKLNYRKTILTGFGFLATSIAWAIYDPYITKILNKILSESDFITRLSNAIADAVPWIGEFSEAQGNAVSLGGGFTLVPLFIGIIMTFDNIFGVIFQPTFGKLSDNCHSKLGKRRPFIVTCAPISALLFALIPVVALNTSGAMQLPLTMITVILFVFSMSLWRAPVVARGCQANRVPLHLPKCHQP